MKKNLPLLSFLLLAFASANAQDSAATVEKASSDGYNKWSIEVNGG